ncbi:MAG: transposase [Planctomycetes bacterium]|nr:transposase [Planctomycetota bacterium]
MLAACFKRARLKGLVAAQPRGAIDSTCFNTRHCSRYFIDRQGPHRGRRVIPGYCKLTAVCDIDSHLFCGAVVSFGRTVDHVQFEEAVRQAAGQLSLGCLLADAGYDGENHHALCRDELGIGDTVFNLNRRNNGRKWPKTPYRREMTWRLKQGDYGQRWQIESDFSRNKRRLGESLRARNESSQQAEVLMRVLTHNLMLLRLNDKDFN